MKFGIVIIVASLIAGTASAEEVKHSGTIIAIAENAIAIEEMGPWTGGQQAVVQRSIAIAPDTKIEVSERSDQPAPTGWPGGFKESALGLRDLRLGEYVTVTVDEIGGRPIAKTITVTPPADEVVRAHLPAGSR